MNRTLAICFAAALSLHARVAMAQAEFIATLDGAQVVPPISTSATATARFTLLADTAIQYQIEVSHLRDVWTVGLYAGATGANGFKAAILFVGPQAGEANGVLAKGRITDRDLLTAAGVSLKDLVELMKKGEAYVQVLTSGHPGGEIRGQVAPASY